MGWLKKNKKALIGQFSKKMSSIKAFFFSLLFCHQFFSDFITGSGRYATDVKIIQSGLQF